MGGGTAVVLRYHTHLPAHHPKKIFICVSHMLKQDMYACVKWFFENSLHFPCPVNHHVNMKVIVAWEIEALLHRPNISPKAQ